MYDNLRKAMKEKQVVVQGVTNKQMADWLGISRQAFQMKLLGRTPFTANERRILARRLRKSISYLFEA